MNNTMYTFHFAINHSSSINFDNAYVRARARALTKSDHFIALLIGLKDYIEHEHRGENQTVAFSAKCGERIRSDDSSMWVGGLGVRHAINQLALYANRE